MNVPVKQYEVSRNGVPVMEVCEAYFHDNDHYAMRDVASILILKLGESWRSTDGSEVVRRIK